MTTSRGYGFGLEGRSWADVVSGDRVVVIAASAGGLEPIGEVLAALKSDFPLPIVVVQHRGDRNAELLPQLLARRTSLDVRHATNGDLLEPGTVFICPPGAHLTAEYCLRVIEGPKLDFVRPSADLMFQSVARSHGERAIVVVLSGRGSDGARGSIAVSQAGGLVFAQAPESTHWAEMPQATIDNGRVDHVMRPAQIGAALQALFETTTDDDDDDDATTTATTTAATARSIIRVLLVDDHRIMLDGLRTLLERERDLEIVGDAEDGRAAIRLARKLSPDVIVLDIAMPRLNGIDAMRRLRLLLPATRVVALSANTDRKTVVQIARAGALGYLPKSAAFGELARAIRSVVRGQPYFNITPPLDAAALLLTNEEQSAPQLSTREREVLQLMAEGSDSTAIARQMGISVALVDAHGARVMEKLGISNVANLTRYAIREGLTSAKF